MRSKVERNEDIVRFKAMHPDLTWQDIGGHFGISAQRANKIYNDYLWRAADDSFAVHISWLKRLFNQIKWGLNSIIRG